MGCADLVNPGNGVEEQSVETETEPQEEPMMSAPFVEGSGGQILVQGATPEMMMTMGGASSGTGASSGSGGSTGPTGPVLLPSCFESSECDDKNPCTDDTCDDAGQCSYDDNGTCECTRFDAETACDDENPCTDDTCVENKCAHNDNTNPCDDDGSACTLNVCETGVCTHPDANLCSDSTITLRSVRDGNEGQWITVTESGLLVWNVAPAAGAATLFDQTPITETTFKLQDVESGLYVALDESDTLVASATEEDGAIFETTDCPLLDAPGVGLSATTDDDGGSFLAAEPGGELIARSGGCAPTSEAAWERFALSPASLP
jgi:hypothetical protein